MSALSDHAENLLLDWLMTNGAASRPTTWYVALFTAAPNDAGGGTEVSTGGYARQSATFTVTGDTASNSALVEFTAGGASFGTVTHIGVFDALTTGNLLWHGAMTASKLVEDGDKLEFSVGNIDLTLA
jgi:hypothetical protein